MHSDLLTITTFSNPLNQIVLLALSSEYNGKSDWNLSDINSTLSTVYKKVNFQITSIFFKV